MPKKAVITADLIRSSSLGMVPRLWLNDKISTLLDAIPALKYDQFRGDGLQCIMEPSRGLRIALLIKTYIKSIEGSSPEEVVVNRLDMRLSLAIGKAEMETEKLGTSDGEAFRLSGQRLDEMKKEKRTFCVTTKDAFERELETEALLLDVLLSKTTPLQCQVFHYKLMGHNETAIAKKLDIKQSAVNQRSVSGGWIAIDKTLKRFEEIYGN